MKNVPTLEIKLSDAAKSVRVFQNMSAADIIREVARDTNLSEETKRQAFAAITKISSDQKNLVLGLGILAVGGIALVTVPKVVKLVRKKKNQALIVDGSVE